MIRVGIQGSSSPVSPVMETDAHARWENQLRTRWTWQWPTKGDSSFGDRRHAANDVMTMTLFIIDGRKTATALFSDGTHMHCDVMTMTQTVFFHTSLYSKAHKCNVKWNTYVHLTDSNAKADNKNKDSIIHRRKMQRKASKHKLLHPPWKKIHPIMLIQSESDDAFGASKRYLLFTSFSFCA